jgi:hypothetical protein
MSGYTPRDGSVAQRVLWFLEEHGASSCTAIAEGVEDVESKQLHACLSSAIAHGAMFTEKRDGVTWYSAKPFAAQETDTRREELQHVLKAEPARADATDRSPTHATPAKAGTRVEPPSPGIRAREGGEAEVVKLTKQLPTRAPRTFGCGIFSDGRLVLELASGADVVLQRDETRALVTFLDRALHEELTA